MNKNVAFLANYRVQSDQSHSFSLDSGSERETQALVSDHVQTVSIHRRKILYGYMR